MEINSIRNKNREKLNEEEMNNLIKKIENELLLVGINSIVYKTNSSRIDVKECRLTNEYINKYGRNQSPYSNITGKILGYYDWVVLQNILNFIFDKYEYSANIFSRSPVGKIIIRKGNEKIDQFYYDRLQNERIGSMFNSQYFSSYWSSNGEGRIGWGYNFRDLYYNNEKTIYYLKYLDETFFPCHIYINKCLECNKLAKCAFIFKEFKNINLDKNKKFISNKADILKIIKKVGSIEMNEKHIII